MVDEQGRPQPVGERRYCVRCCSTAFHGEATCPGCGASLTKSAGRWLDGPAVAIVLNDLHALRRGGVVGERCFGSLRDTYEARLDRLRPSRISQPLHPALPELPPRTANAPAQPATPESRREPGIDIAAWTAARQADILLYLGSFLLSIAALILVGYQGRALGGPLRLGILGGYTVGFLASGLALPRWRRVREAGRVFLGLGALLVPINVIAVRTQLFPAGAAPDRLLFLLGASLTAALYFLLARRGYGRAYAAGGAIATLLAWGAGAAFVYLPPSWFGAWYLAAVLLLRLVALAPQLRARRRLLDQVALAVALAALALSHLAALFEPSSFELTASWALVTAALAAGLPRGDRLASVAVLPASAGITAFVTANALFGLSTPWQPLFMAATGVAYRIAARFDAAARLRNWESAAAACGMLGLYAALTLAAGGAEPRAALPATILVLLIGVACCPRFWRRPETMAVLAPIAALLSASALWASGRAQWDWAGCWIAAVALAYLATAEAQARLRGGWRLVSAITGIVAGVAALVLASEPGAASLELPLTLALLTCGGVWEALRGRLSAFFTLATTAALTASATMWALDVPAEWWAFPALLALAALVATRQWWTRDQLAAESGWAAIVAVAVALPLAFSFAYQGNPAQGAAAALIGAAIVFAAALMTRGRLARALGFGSGPAASGVERQMLARLSSALLFVAAGYVNALLGAHGPDRAGVFELLALSGWLSLAAFGGVRSDLFGVLAPQAVVATLTGVLLSGGDAAQSTAILALSASGAAVAFVSTRRSSLWLFAGVALGVALPYAWQWRQLPATLLPPGYVIAGAVLWVALIGVRRYRHAGSAVAGALTWLPLGVGLALSTAQTLGRALALDQPHEVVHTQAWAVLTICIASVASAVLFEGLRLRKRAIWAAGSGGLLLALLTTIAVAEPSNVQAYTLPVGLYLLGLAAILGLRRPEPGRDRSMIESLQVAGMLVLTLAPAFQSFGPGGDRYGLEMIGMGVLFLTAGASASARWLAAGGVLSLTCVALRWLALFGSRAPYWLTLGVAGILLLAAGTLLLFQRERWERARRSIGAWWSASGAATSGR